jgi:uncharacterized cupin superfamily protein
LDPSQIVSGDPQVSCLIFSDDGHICRGIWKCTKGVCTDTEQDEMFTVIEGHATVAIEDGPTLEIFPGFTRGFKKGTKTIWTINEDILKTFQITIA